MEPEPHYLYYPFPYDEKDEDLSNMTKLTGNSAENQHQITSSDMMTLTRDSATLFPYSFVSLVLFIP